MSDRAIPILTCRNLDDVLPFYEALGSEKTFRQERPTPHGNWLRFTAHDDDAGATTAGVFERVMLNAARQGGARGDTAVAISVLETALDRHPVAQPVERAPVLAYLAELPIPADEPDRARQIFAELRSRDLTETERSAIAGELSAAAELEEGL